MIIRYIFNIVIFMGMGFLFYSMGYGPTTWQYWAMLALLAGTVIGNVILLVKE